MVCFCWLLFLSIYSDDLREIWGSLPNLGMAVNTAVYISKNLTHLLYIIIKFTENNTVFQTRHNNFHILQFTEMRLHLSESQINCASSDVQHFVLRPMEKGGESLVWPIYASRYEIVMWKNLVFFVCFVMYLCEMTSYANNMGGFFICTIQLIEWDQV